MFIYIASPYTNPDPILQTRRFQQAYNYTRGLMQMGHNCFSPIVYGHQFHINGHAPANYEWWRDFNDRMLLSSDLVHVLQLPGWQASRGIKHEIHVADAHGIPTIFVSWDRDESL